MVDVEADGPIPGVYSMIGVGAVVVEEGLKRRFRADLAPISDLYEQEALDSIGMTRQRTLAFEDAEDETVRFAEWLEGLGGSPMFVSDNNGFDWMFSCWYLHKFAGRNPFGYSSTNLGSLYKGAVRDMRKSFRHLRRTPHTHDPLDDALGNAEAMLAMFSELRIRTGRGSWL